MALPAIASALGRVALGGANMAGGGAGRAIGLSQLAGGLGQLARSATGALGSVTGLASSITQKLLGPLEHVRELFSSIGHLVGLFNPGIVAQFTLALNDTLAVLGSALVPVLQGMTVYVRSFGDALAKLLPTLQPIFDSIGQFIASYAQGFVPILEAAAPFINAFGVALAELLRKISTGVAFFQGVVAELLDTLAGLFGMRGMGAFDKDATSRGFAARQTKVSGVEQFARDVFASTARNIYARQGEGKRPEQLLAEIKGAIDEGRKSIQAIRTAVEAIYKWLVEKPEQVRQAVNNIAEDPGGAGGKAVRAAMELRRIMIKP